MEQIKKSKKVLIAIIVLMAVGLVLTALVIYLTSGKDGIFITDPANPRYTEAKKIIIPKIANIIDKKIAENKSMTPDDQKIYKKYKWQIMEVIFAIFYKDERMKDLIQLANSMGYFSNTMEDILSEIKGMIDKLFNLAMEGLPNDDTAVWNSSYKNIKIIDLSGLNVGNLTPALKAFSGVKKIILSKTNVGDEDVDMLECMESLETIVADLNPKITKIPYLSRFKAAKEFFLRETGITSVNVEKIAAACLCPLEQEIVIHLKPKAGATIEGIDEGTTIIIHPNVQIVVDATIT